VLESVDIGRQSIGDYEATAGREAVERLRILAESLNITCANPVPWSSPGLLYALIFREHLYFHAVR
jgi:hypothetical protein